MEDFLSPLPSVETEREKRKWDNGVWFTPLFLWSKAEAPLSSPCIIQEFVIAKRIERE